MAKRYYSLKYYYNLFNSRYFRGRLPKDCQVFWGDMYRQGCPEALGVYKPGYQILAQRVRGYHKGKYRVLSNRKDSIAIDRRLFFVGNKVTLMTLLHEMVHLKLKDTHAGHGHAFQREMKRLAKVGAFNSWW